VNPGQQRLVCWAGLVLFFAPVFFAVFFAAVFAELFFAVAITA